MNGILIVGDVRFHAVFYQSEITSGRLTEPSEFGTTQRTIDGWVHGGAFMVADLVQMALFDLPRKHVAPGKRDVTPVMLAYPEQRAAVHTAWDYSWSFQAKENRRLGAKRFVLTEPSKRYETAPVHWLPPVDFEPTQRCTTWARRLSTDDNYQVSTFAAELSKIELLIVDDLNKSYRLKTQLDGSGSSSNISLSPHANIVNSVLDRFELQVGKRIEPTQMPTDKAPLLQPMIVVNLKSIPEKGDRGYWGRILSNERLSERTVAVLDADALRRDRFQISESRSWELTSQDFIDELQKNDRLAELRKIGHLVVRFGVTGVLYARRDRFDWTFRLYFFPEHDDREFTTAEDGVILGYGAVLTASLVRALWKRCDETGRNPFVTSLPDVMEDGLIHGLRACNYLCRVGYGQNPGDEGPFSRKPLTSFRDQTEKWISGFPRDMFLRTLPFDERMDLQAKLGTARMLPFEDLIDNANVAVTPVFAPPTPQWSFLSHSCRNRVPDTAFDIAMHGVDQILNLPTWSHCRIKHSLFISFHAAKFIRAWTDYLPKKIEIEKWLTNPIEKHFEFIDRWEREFCENFAKLIASEVVKLGPLGKRSILDRARVNDRCVRYLLELQHGKKKISDWILVFSPELLGIINDIVYRVPLTDKRPKLRQAIRRLVKLLASTRISRLTKSATTRLDGAVEQLVDDMTISFGETFWPVHAPVAKYGPPKAAGGLDPKMIVVDRREIEGYRTLANLIQGHLEKIAGSRRKTGGPPVERPLSLALFGPPGAGKSYAIKQIVEVVKPDLDVESITFNLAEFTSVQQIADAFVKVSQAISGRKVPIVFFDEFDSSVGKEPLAWLKTFLAPMEDGGYQGASVKESIFVFAGATASTFAEFSRHSRNRTDPHWLEFATAKGPDFVSRLHGHMDLMGVNPTGPDDDLYLIRRALFLRSRLVAMANLEAKQKSPIDKDLLYALLHSPAYRHGGRSMRIILELCHRHGEVRKSTIPPISQLDMHVDGKAFMDLVTRGSNR